MISDWLALASDDPAQHKLWQDEYRDRLSFWGVPCGPINDMLVLDIDVKGKSNGFQTIKDLNLPIPATQSQLTPSGGKHYIFTYPKDGKDYKNRVNFLPGLDIRSRGGWIAWYGSCGLLRIDAPEWLLDEINKTKDKPTVDSQIKLAPEIAMGIFEKCIDTIRSAGEGERNHTLNTEAFKIGQLLTSSDITQEYANEEIKKAALEIGLDPGEIRATTKSGFSGGKSNPLTCPFSNDQPIVTINIPDPPKNPELEARWTPPYMTRDSLMNSSCLRKPQLFKNWSTEDIHITTADGGTGKTTLKLYEAVCLALGERFLGFDCVQQGKTLYITGEDTQAKLSAMVGAIMKQMGLFDGTPESNAKINIVLDSVVIKKDSDLCLIAKGKDSFLTPNSEAMTKLSQAIEDIKPKMIVFDPIASFWGSESALNDMNKAVAKFMQTLQEKSNACVEMLNHMGKVSSQSKDMSQFAGRGGTGLPSHSRVARVLRGVDAQEYKELTGEDLAEKESAMMCNVGKFSDGSPLTNEPFLIVRSGMLFGHKTIVPNKEREGKDVKNDIERVYEFIKNARLENKEPTKAVLIGYFKIHAEPLSEARVKGAINLLVFQGFNGELVKQTVHPDETVKENVFIITDQDGVEKYWS